MRSGDDASADRAPRAGAIRFTVLAVCLLGAALSVAALHLLRDHPPGSWLAFFVLVPVATALQLYRSRVRHRGAEQSVSLFDAALVAGLLLLSPEMLLFVALFAVGFAELKWRHEPIKVLFNLGCFAGATSLMLLVYHAVSGPADAMVRETGTISWRVLAALLLAEAAFLAYNGITLYRILSLVSGTRIRDYYRRELPINATLLVGSVAIGTPSVLVLSAAPALLPVVFAAGAVTLYVLRQASLAATSDNRSTQMASMIALMSRDATADPIPAFQAMLKRTFEADWVMAVTEQPGGPQVTELDDDGNLLERPATPEEADLLAVPSIQMSAPRTTGLPPGWSRALLAPFETLTGTRGVLSLGFSKDSPSIITSQDASLLATLAVAAGVAIQSSVRFRNLAAVTSSQTEGVVTVTSDGVASFVNPAAREMLGLDDEAFPNLPVEELLTVCRDGDPIDLEALASTRSIAEEVLLVPMDGNGRAPEVVVDCSAAPLEGAGGYVLVLRDVSERVSSRARLAETEDALVRLGRTLQASLLPPSLPTHPLATVASRYHPATEGLDVGGDFYDVYVHSDEAWSLVIGDVCGRGPEAAALTAVTRYSFRAAAAHLPPPSELLETVNMSILSRAADDDSRFCTVAAARIDYAAQALTVSLGGHPPVLLVRSTGEVLEVGEFGAALGLIDDPMVSDVTVPLLPGDLVLLYTDGVIESRSSEHEFFEGRLYELLPSFAGLDAEEVAARLDAALSDFRAPDYSDDTAFLVLSYRGPFGPPLP